MAMKHSLATSEQYSKMYAEIRLSHNQVKNMLYQNLQSVQEITVQLNKDKVESLTKDEVVEVFLTNLHRKEIIEIIHMLSLIVSRGSKVKSYLQYILLGIYNKG
ncbi:hypothetical protein J6TS2_14400 [Heyndrickxia sporothermodurans]|nr:hypothetical protein J6TS2_14400 [Heyndrickxia sporothermodurans]